MSELKFAQFKIEIYDHYIDQINGFVGFDLLLKSDDASEIMKFIEDFHVDKNENQVIEYYIDEDRYKGNMGNFIYDSQGNARLWMTTKPTDKPSTGALSSMVVTKRSVPYYNLLRAFVDLEKRFNTLTDLLKEKNILTQEEVENIGYYLTPRQEGININHEVKDLKKYLEDTEDTLESIRLNS